MLEEDPNKWPTSRELCEAHGIAGDWQIGLTMVFMRDGTHVVLICKARTAFSSRFADLTAHESFIGYFLIVARPHLAQVTCLALFRSHVFEAGG